MSMPIEEIRGEGPKMTLQIDLPEETAKKFNVQYIKEAVAAVSYYNGTLSEKEACLLAGTTRRQFEERVLPRFHLSVMGGTQEDIDIELEGL